MSETKTEKQFANPANDYIVVRKSELADAYSRVEELERILRKIVKSDFPHAVWCNYQHPSCKSCNCGMADAHQALSGKSEPVEPKEKVEIERLQSENDILWAIYKTCPGCSRIPKGIVYGCEIQRHINLSGHCNQYVPVEPKEVSVE